MSSNYWLKTSSISCRKVACELVLSYFSCTMMFALQTGVKIFGKSLYFCSDDLVTCNVIKNLNWTLKTLKRKQDKPASFSIRKKFIFRALYNKSTTSVETNVWFSLLNQKCTRLNHFSLVIVLNGFIVNHFSSPHPVCFKQFPSVISI